MCEKCEKEIKDDPEALATLLATLLFNETPVDALLGAIKSEMLLGDLDAAHEALHGFVRTYIDQCDKIQHFKAFMLALALCTEVSHDDPRTLMIAELYGLDDTRQPARDVMEFRVSKSLPVR